MASVPLAALAVRPVESPDLLGNYGKLVALKSMLQEQQFRQQAQPLQIQQQQVALQEAQQNLQDQKAGMQAFQQWDGKSYDDLAHLIANNGGSLKSIQAVQAYALNQRKTLSEIAANNGKAGLDQITSLQKQGDANAGAVAALTDPNQHPDQTLNQDFAAWAQGASLDQNHQQLAARLLQLPPQQLRQALVPYGKGFLADSQQAEDALRAAQQANEAAKTPGLQATSAKQVAEQQEMAASGLTPSQFEAQAAGAKKKAEEAAAFPYQSRLVAVRQQVENQFWNNKDAIGKVEQNVVKPFTDQMQQIAQLNSALDQAAAGNSAAAQAVIPKLVGISQPVGSRRYNAAEAAQLAQQGGIPARFVGTIQKAINGDQWTPQMISDMRELAKAQQDVAVNSANAQIDNINTLHKTSIGHLDAPASAPSPTGKIRARDPQGVLHEAPAGTPLPQGWKPE